MRRRLHRHQPHRYGWNGPTHNHSINQSLIDVPSTPYPQHQALHHLAALQQPPSTATAIFAAMGAWLELDWLPWDTVVGPWLPRALELAHAAVGRWAAAGGGGEEEEAEAAAAAVLELLTGAWTAFCGVMY